MHSSGGYTRLSQGDRCIQTFAANIIAGDPFEMVARGKYVLSQSGSLGENCALLVDGYVEKKVRLLAVIRFHQERWASWQPGCLPGERIHSSSGYTRLRQGDRCIQTFSAKHRR
jgi:hypothetical protein